MDRDNIFIIIVLILALILYKFIKNLIYGSIIIGTLIVGYLIYRHLNSEKFQDKEDPCHIPYNPTRPNDLS